MADFADILAAIDRLRGTTGLSRFAEQARSMAEDSLSADPFLALMYEAKVEFTGKASELLVKVTPDIDGWRPPRNWPKDPRSVTSLLKRNAPALRKSGWVVEDEPDSDHFTIWTVIHPEKVRIRPPESPPSPPQTEITEITENKYGQTQDDCTVRGDVGACTNHSCAAFGMCVLAA